MGYTTEDLSPVQVGPQTGPTQFNIPAKEFIGYDQSTVQPKTEQQEAPVVQTGNPANVGEQIQEEIQLSPKLTAIARKEQAQRAKEKALAEEKKTFGEKLALADKFEAIKKRIAEEDYTALDELGFKYSENFVKHEINKESSKNPEAQKVKELEERIEALTKAQEEKEVSDYETNQSLWKQEIKKTVDENPEFSTIKDLEAYDIVLQHVNDSFEEDGVELSVEQAAKEIEDALVAKAEKFANVTKIKNKAPAPKVLGAPPKPKVQTITQNLTTTPKTSASRPFHLMSESEQIAEAIRRVQAEKLQRQQG